ncbi:MAG: helix-turn-helix domain-containing protein [Eggerthellaceae bacterium]|nr:helix-turn-helix domain-containing protein [Eggerthellaceae bacterium]
MKATVTKEQFEQMPLLIGVREVAALLGMHPRTVQLKARTGELPGKKLGDGWKFNKVRVAQYGGLIDGEE